MSTALSGRVRGQATPARLARYTAYAFMVTMPWAAVFADALNPHDVARMFQSLVICTAACALLAFGGPWWPAAPSRRAALVAVFVLGCLSVGTADKMSYAALEASALVLLLTLSLVLARADTDELLRELPAVVALSALLSVLLELPRLVYFLADGRVPQAGDFGFMYMSHRFFNHTQSVMLPMAFLALLVPCPRWARIAAWIGVIGGLALSLRTGGRGTLLALTLFGVALPLVLKWQVRQVVRTLAIAGIGAVVAYLVFFVLPAELLALAPDHRGNAARVAVAGDAGRLYLWNLALENVTQHPWVGIGPMHYAHQPNLLAAHPHNSLVQWAAEWGIPMTLCVLAGLGAQLVRAGQRLRSTRPSDINVMLAIAGLATFVGAIDSLVSGTLVMPVSQTWWFIALGCMLTALYEPQVQKAAAGAAPRRVVVYALVAVHVSLSAWTYQRSVEPPQITPTGLQRTNVPRYWVNGFF
jgi:O-antigen ligase